MLRYILILFFLSNFSFSVGQTLKIIGIVYKANTKEGLPYCSFAIKGSSRGTISDYSGNFSFIANPNDTVIISSVGFKTKILSVRNFEEIVYLEESITELEGVTISSRKKFKSKVIGNTKSKTKYLFGGSNQYAFLLLNQIGSEGFVKDININIHPSTNKKERFETFIRIRFYENVSGQPGRDIINDNIFAKLNSNVKSITVDVSNYNVQLPLSGLFIGIDLLGIYDANDNFIPYNVKAIPLNTRIEFTEDANFLTLRKFFGTEWVKVLYPTKSGELVNVSAKFSVKIEY
jgi:hypothetical protein